jgi:hypothetical protein
MVADNTPVGMSVAEEIPVEIAGAGPPIAYLATAAMRTLL